MRANTQSESYFQRGLRCSTGQDGPEDLVAAHKWFNLAALNGHSEAAQHRQEIAGSLSAAEIADALRAARAELRLN